MRTMFLIALLSFSQLSPGDECRLLFNGQDLEGWKRVGEAPFEIEDRAIKGIPIDDKQNTFLVTREEFTNFELSLEFKYQAGMFNSGVQFRSAIYEEETPVTVRARDGQWHDWTMDAGRVYGYQADIDPSDRAWTGEIYDEASRGWLETFDKTPLKQPIEPDTWHELIIFFEGDRLITWLDGVQIANFSDNKRDKGFIALQVHGIYEPEQLGKAIWFRNIQICPM